MRSPVALYVSVALLYPPLYMREKLPLTPHFHNLRPLIPHPYSSPAAFNPSPGEESEHPEGSTGAVVCRKPVIRKGTLGTIGVRRVACDVVVIGGPAKPEAKHLGAFLGCLLLHGLQVELYGQEVKQEVGKAPQRQRLGCWCCRNRPRNWGRASRLRIHSDSLCSSRRATPTLTPADDSRARRLPWGGVERQAVIGPGGEGIGPHEGAGMTGGEGGGDGRGLEQIAQHVGVGHGQDPIDHAGEFVGPAPPEARRP